MVAAVLLGHGLVLEWLSRQAQAQAAMRLMATPMFTRLLQPQAPPPVPEVNVAAAPVRRARPAIQTITPSVPAQATRTYESTPTPTPAPAPAPTLADLEPEPVTLPLPELEAVAETALPQATPTVATIEPLAATATTAISPVESTPASTPSAAPLDSWPVDTRLNYRLGGYYRGELHGSAKVQWQRQGERYQAQLDIDLGPVGMVITSQGEVTPRGLMPEAYEEVRTSKRRNTQLQPNTIVLSDGRQVPRPEGVQDAASQFVELSHAFSTGRLALEVGRSVSFWMARPGGVDLWTYDIAQREMLQTPQLGTVEAFHLKPRPLADARGKIMAEMWFAPSLQYLPVRIRVTMGEAAHVDLFVETIEQR